MSNKRSLEESVNPPPSAGSQAFRQGWPWLLIILALMGLLVWFATLRGTGAPEVGKGDLFLLLAPFLAIATAIERFWEALFDWYERFALATARLIGVGASSAIWMKTELKNAEDAVSDAVQALAGKNPSDANYTFLWNSFQEAETRLLDAKSRITELLKTPEYVAIKRAITLIGSLIFGLVISVSAKLTLLNSAGFPIPLPVDILLTGLLVGAGPGPLHSFIGILSELRNTVAGLADLARGNAVKGVEDPRARLIPNVVINSERPNLDMMLTGPEIRSSSIRIPMDRRIGEGAVGAPVGDGQRGDEGEELAEAAAIREEVVVVPAQYLVANDNLRTRRQTQRILGR